MLQVPRPGSAPAGRWGVGPPLCRAFGMVGEGVGLGRRRIRLKVCQGWGRGDALACASRDLRLMYGMWGWKAAIIAQ